MAAALPLGYNYKNLNWNDFQMSFKVIKSGTNQKLVYELLLVVYSNFHHHTLFPRYKLF